MHPHDPAADPTSFGIPTYVIADFKCLRHGNAATIRWALSDLTAERRIDPVD
jgi:hypothetical protein